VGVIEPVGIVQGKAAPLPRANVDTDQIIPKQWLKSVKRTGFGRYLFWDWAHDQEGELDPEFVINRPEYADAVILISGPNFGCGSSREHAPWAIEDRGFQAVIAPSFADIFRTNCHKIGLLPVVLTEDEVAELTVIAEDPDVTVTVNLEAQRVSAPGFEASFVIDPFVKHCLQNGLDHVDLTLRHDDEVESYETTRRSFKPSLATADQ
jgi:3-isopropylmalate/(R)-2-methylmalate dehydratase small subunit